MCCTKKNFVILVLIMNYTWLKTFVEDLALQPNGRLRMDCPVCTKKNTFSVTDDGFSRMYNCFYANCDAKGSTKMRLTKDNSRIAFSSVDKSRVVAKPTEFHLPTTFVPLSRSQKAVDYVRSVNSYQAYLDNYVDIMYDIRFDRAVFLIKEKSRVVDAVGKSLSNQKPKWYRYGSTNFGFNIDRGCHNIFIVEDCPSAVSICSFVSSIALLGTSLLPQHITTIKNYKKAIVALDKDATSKSCLIARKLSQYVDTTVAFLSNDLKDLKDDEREQFVRKYIN